MPPPKTQEQEDKEKKRNIPQANRLEIIEIRNKLREAILSKPKIASNKNLGDNLLKNIIDKILFDDLKTLRSKNKNIFKNENIDNVLKNALREVFLEEDDQMEEKEVETKVGLFMGDSVRNFSDNDEDDDKRPEPAQAQAQEQQTKSLLLNRERRRSSVAKFQQKPEPEFREQRATKWNGLYRNDIGEIFETPEDALTGGMHLTNMLDKDGYEIVKWDN